MKRSLLVGTMLSTMLLLQPAVAPARDDGMRLAQNPQSAPAPDKDKDNERDKQKQRPGQQRQEQRQQQPQGAQPPAQQRVQQPPAAQPPAQPKPPQQAQPAAPQPPQPPSAGQPPQRPTAQQPPAVQQQQAQPPASAQQPDQRRHPTAQDQQRDQQQRQDQRQDRQRPGQPPAQAPTAQQPTPSQTPTVQQPPAPQQQQAQPPASVQPPGQRPAPTAQQPSTPQQQQAQPPASAQQPGQRPAPTAQQPAPIQTPPGAQQLPVPGAPQQAARPAPTTPPAPSALQTLQPQAPAAGQAQGQAAAPAFNRTGRIDDVRRERREVREGDRNIIQEGGRVIIQEAGRAIIRHNEIERFRANARDVRIERHGNETVTVIERPDGSRIVTVTDEYGRLVRRSRRGPDGREFVLIDNRYRGPAVVGSYYIDLPPPVIRIPRERYIVEAERASREDIYAALIAPPVEHIDRRYTLDEVRYSPRLLERMPRVDLDTVTFETGSWELTPDQVGRLAVIADGLKRAVAANPGEVFLIQGHTDAVGADVDNLSLSDRRAESVALALTEQFQVPSENLTTQGYGEQYLKVKTDGPERLNRRVTVQRITPLLSGGEGQTGQPG